MTYPGSAPQNTPWGVGFPEVPGQRSPEQPRPSMARPYTTPAPPAPPAGHPHPGAFPQPGDAATEVISLPPAAPTAPPPPPEAAPPGRVLEGSLVEDTAAHPTLDPAPGGELSPPDDRGASGEPPTEPVTEPVAAAPGGVDEPVTEPVTVPPATPSAARFGAAAPGAPVLPQASAEKLRARFAATLPMFVDDPAAAVAEAETVVGEAIDAVSEALRDRQRTLRSAGAGGSDTESLRITLREYRGFLEQLLDR